MVIFALGSGTESLRQLSGERRDFYPLPHTSIPKEELSQFFDQCLHSNFRIWLSEICFNAAKHSSLPHLQNQRRLLSNRMENLKKRQKTGKKV